MESACLRQVVAERAGAAHATAAHPPHPLEGICEVEELSQLRALDTCQGTCILLPAWAGGCCCTIHTVASRPFFEGNRMVRCRIRARKKLDAAAMILFLCACVSVCCWSWPVRVTGLACRGHFLARLFSHALLDTRGLLAHTYPEPRTTARALTLTHTKNSRVTCSYVRKQQQNAKCAGFRAWLAFVHLRSQAHTSTRSAAIRSRAMSFIKIAVAWKHQYQRKGDIRRCVEVVCGAGSRAACFCAVRFAFGENTCLR